MYMLTRSTTRCISSIGCCIKTEKFGKAANILLLSMGTPSGAIPPAKIMRAALCEKLVDVKKDQSIGAVILTGIDSFGAESSSDDILHLVPCVDLVADLNCPTVAAVDGSITGIGTELAMACDIIYASESSTFSLNQLSLGTIPGAGGSQRLSRVVGKSLAMEAIFSGEPFSAIEAKRTGLVSRVFPSRRLLKDSIRMGERLVSFSPLIQSMAKEAMATSQETTLRDGLRMESRLFEMTFSTKDRNEGMTAHLEQRQPVFRGK